MLNKIFLMGRLVADPELRTTPSGTPVATFRIAVDRDFKNKETGERETDFVTIVAWRSTAEFVSRYFTKGRMAVVEGRLQIRPYTDRDGNKRSATEVVADSVYFGDSKREGDGGGYGDYGQPTGGCGGGYGGQPSGAARPPQGGYPSSDYGRSQDQFTELEDDDGDLPF
ncbi:MAG: single-stranded DNA-binding protein [Roseburia sp.]|nr:single-stranded DNA-binding protein [Roseburia sp.]